MNNYNVYTARCPDVHDFEKALNNDGDFEFRLNFYNHLESCALCNEAYEGYRMAGISQIKPILNAAEFVLPKKQAKYSYRFIGYAATIVLLVGSFFMFKYIADEKQYNKQMIMSNNNIITEKVESDGPKKLMAKAEENYWYISKDNELKLNDQVIQLNDLNALNLEQGNRAIVEVASNDTRLTNELIEKLRVEKNQTVLTYSKQKELKRMNLNDDVAI